MGKAAGVHLRLTVEVPPPAGMYDGDSEIAAPGGCT
jgi:hypothetical protein